MKCGKKYTANKLIMARLKKPKLKSSVQILTPSNYMETSYLQKVGELTEIKELPGPKGEVFVVVMYPNGIKLVVNINNLKVV
jgi:hypothetical protein